MSREEVERGSVLWSWAVKGVCLGVFAWAGFGDENPNFAIAFLAICGAVLPIREFRVFLRSWRRPDGPTSSPSAPGGDPPA